MLWGVSRGGRVFVGVLVGWGLLVVCVGVGGLCFLGALVATVLGRGEVVEVGDGGVVDSVDGEGNVRRVLAGGLVDAVVGHASVDDNGGVIGFLGSPVMPPTRDDGVRGARLVRNRDGGRVEVVRCGGRVEGAAARVENMSGRADAWAEIGVVDYFATARRERGNPVVGRLGPYSRVHFESHNAREVLACIGRVDVGALEAGLVDVTYGSRRESLLPLLRERGGVCGCHRAVSITARESVCWLVAASGWAAGS